MDDIELKQLWKAYDHKLERSLALNLHIVTAIQTQKANAKLRSLAIFKKIAVVIGILWVIFLGCCVLHSFAYQKIFFVVSALAVMIITSITILLYIYQIVLIRQINNSESITATQTKLSVLQASTLQGVRIAFLQMPFYTTFFFSPAWISSDWAFWLIPLPITLVFATAAIWLYRNINFKNADKKWFRVLFNTPEWKNVIKAKEFVGEIEKFKEEL
ncbi:MAG: hypothetical protein ABJA78_13140 [Ferruginibacter sp.]